jgi:hypothetical protein
MKKTKDLPEEVLRVTCIAGARFVPQSDARIVERLRLAAQGGLVPGFRKRWWNLAQDRQRLRAGYSRLTAQVTGRRRSGS